ncbi:MAG: putative DNA binding domain-containing protein [Elusimicrobiales bacterium]|nr:putative DNA binding domain-containing protein [Elusimicrobiales bacterium]
MTTDIAIFNSWLKQHEGLNLEFKAARNSFSHDKDLPDYCAALANEGGGMLILGVDDKTHEVVGTNAFHGNHAKLSHDLLNTIKIRVDVEELHHPDGRVLIFHVPARQPGQPVQSTGRYKYPMRVGESIVEMDNMKLKQILTELDPDFSTKIVPELKLSDMDESAVDNFRRKWAQKANRSEYLQFSTEKLLRAICIMSDSGINYGGLVLFGKKEKLDQLLPTSEIIFEWRGIKKIPHDFRKTWREPFSKIYDEVWNTIDARNLRSPFQEGLIQREVFAFNEKAIREALLNAVAHRDYTLGGRSIFITASPEDFDIESPGGFPLGITPDNILVKRFWRNRVIAETFEKAGLVERAGQGMNDIFSSSIREGKGMPDFSGSDSYSVHLHIPTQLKDKDFILFLEKVAKDKQILLSFEEIYELERIREQKTWDLQFKDKFLDLGIIERVGRTSGAKYILAHAYYKHAGKPGVHTRLAGISRDKRKELILSHIEKNEKGFVKDFMDILPELGRADINNMLQELRKDGKIKFIGPRRSGYWVLSGKTI